MPLILHGKQFDRIQFEQGENGSLFILSSTDGESELAFDYLPIVDSSFNCDQFEVILLENNFLNAENDVFTLYEHYQNTSGKNEAIRVGWVFPITCLESNDSEFSINPHLHGYLYVAFEHLLKAKSHLKPAVDVRENQSGKYLLSDFYGENTILAVINKMQVPSYQESTLQCYIPSFSQYGYFKRNEFELNHHLDDEKCIYLKQRGRERLYLRRAKNISLIDNHFFNDLYAQYFKTISNPLLRFYLNYQVIEHIIGEQFDKDFEKAVEKYQKSKIQKNDFIEEINELKKERKNIRKVFSLYKSNHDDAKVYLADLQRDCKDILENHTEVKDEVGDLVYDVRNLLVHNYRKLSYLERDKLNQINMVFELVTADLLIYGVAT